MKVIIRNNDQQVEEFFRIADCKTQILYRVLLLVVNKFKKIKICYIPLALAKSEL